MAEKRANMPEPVAIIGTSCRLPGGVDTPSKLWELLKSPVDLLTDIPNTRFNPTAFYHGNAEHPGTTNVTKAYLLKDDPLAFDNDFFNISAREAESMDPQQRILLEIAYEAIESAGYSISQLKGSSTGVFVGQMSDDYRDLILRDVDCHPLYTGTGIARSILANRVSYAFDWKGPSVNIDTACSSSLVALHQAVQSLRNEECDVAVVAGVNLVFNPELFSFLSSLRMLSPTGRSRMWDIDADGYARGEGFAAIVIKTLKKAVADGDDIESVIRNTGVNQDGRSAGLTVPSAVAQAQLMKSTYARCGLDCLKEEDRCQYFEAHGTGTLAGDPKEAEGISMTFFPDQNLESRNGLGTKEKCPSKIYVGSIKTVIGHTEGTAGLASLLKASQAVKHGIIPPNLHFNRLNPEIEPYYRGLEVPTNLNPWPELAPGAPRRASVNSFGFGGTNAHAIIESWEGQATDVEVHAASPCWGPFVLSANSETALEATIALLEKTLQHQNKTDLSRLAWTLQTRRTQFTHRAAFSASTKEELLCGLRAAIESKGKRPISTKPVEVARARILGVFTGQGAQWASMGARLLQDSACFRLTFKTLEAILKTIPSAPTWSLSKELLRRDDPARISSAEISQPLCTALQIALVDLLRECGVTFSAVIGHSSGEIGAAYAAGVLDATDAIKIAFYRGYHCHRASDREGKMMAVGMAPEEAEMFCKQPQFLDKISVAANNSSSSSTISGDSQTIEEAKKVLDERSIFARILKTDMAYHSHHMQAIRGPYVASLDQCKIQPRRNVFGGPCNWYSSVYRADDGQGLTASASFESTYWADNLTNPVLFSSAVISAIQGEKFDLALEIGPHPALQGPATECIREVSGDSLPYRGVLTRTKDALDEFSSALGFIWSNINSPVCPVNFNGFRWACTPSNWTPPRVHKNLSPYQWDHNRSMLKESRKSKAWRTRSAPFHELLGSEVSSGIKECRWRNILRLSDLDWLQGHKFQNQVLLPASGYLVMAMNAALKLFGDGQVVQIIELQDVVIHNGITLEEGSQGVDMEFTIRALDGGLSNKTAEFFCRCRNADASTPEFDKEVVTGRVLVELGPAIENLLPNRIIPVLPMTGVDTDRFYFWMDKVGLQYSEPFILESIKRRLNLATVTTTRAPSDSYKIHPGTLDTILQGLYAAFSYPGDGRVWTTYLPKSFRRVRFNMNSCREMDSCTNSRLVADCYLTQSSARAICGDIDVFCTGDGCAEIQAEGIVLSSLEVPNMLNDRPMFWKTIWKRDLTSLVELPEVSPTRTLLTPHNELYETCERTAYFYLNRLLKEVARNEILSPEWHFKFLMDWAHKSVGPLLGRQGHWRPEWDMDTLESINKLREQQIDELIDLDLIHHLGSRLHAILRGSESALQVLRTDGMLEKLYSEGLGVPETNGQLGALLDQIVHQYPKLKVLEIGAGTGGSTSIALQHLGSRLEDYTFTDISPGYFPAAQVRFAAHKALLKFQVLDIERSPVDQGFQANSYDVVIAAHVIHATKSIAQTLQHCRRLLRPGGYLILLEVTNPISLRIPFLFSCLPGWWLGHEDGRSERPTLTEAQWNRALSDSNFSGVDHAFRDFKSSSLHTFSVMISQALDDQISALREPINLARDIARIKTLVIIGGDTLAISKTVAKIQLLLRPFAEHITVISSLDRLLGSDLQYGSAVICLSELDEATFKRMNHQRVSAMQSLFREAKYMLWATRGSRDSDPYANITVGIGRSASRELAHLRLKFVDFDDIQLHTAQANAVLLSEMLLQMVCIDTPGSGSMLWANETEVAVEDGAILIPRVIPDESLNDSFNSSRRKITRSASFTSNTVCVASRGGEIVIREISTGPKPGCSGSVQVLSSSMIRFSCSDENQPFYLCVGISEDTKKTVLTVSDTNSSVVEAAPGLTFPCEVDANTNEILAYILTVLICESLLSSCNGTIWIHNADDTIAEIVYQQAIDRAVSVFLTTSNISSSLVSARKATYIHPRAAERKFENLVPRNTRRFIDMGAETSIAPAVFAASFPSGKMEIHKGIYQASVDQNFDLRYDKPGLIRILEGIYIQPDLFREYGQLVQKEVVKIDHVHAQTDVTPVTTIISWVDVPSTQIQMTPASTAQLFQDQKTYFLIGLAGDVGLSLCNWMADHGAKFLAIASRNPNVPPAMIAHLERKGIVVRTFSLDVANIENLKNVHQEITSSMPPIAGVANAALVVRDHPFDSMSFSDLEAVFKPKVIGSQNLDDLFFSTPLDFFILFSSIASIVGKPAQSSYNAANLFMTTLAVKRRKRGLAASVMHFGMLLGVGFIHGQAGPTVEARFRQDDLPAIPEPEFHEIFAQAVLSGRPESGLSPEVIAGLGSEIDTPWRAIPRFWHCRIKGDEMSREDQDKNPQQSTQTIQSRLKVASSSDESLSVLKSAISHRVGLAIGSPSENVDEQVGLISLGVDSLVAVEVRSWLLKILEVDVPVLKFLSGSSLQDICHDILGKLPGSLRPWSNNHDSQPNEEAVGVNTKPPDAVTRSIAYSNGSSNAHKFHATQELNENNIPVNNPESHMLSHTPPSSQTLKKNGLQLRSGTEYERVGDMSHAQAQLYFLHEYLQNNAYNVAYSGYFHGQLDVARLRKALWVACKRHEAMRSAYFMDVTSARPVQAVLSEPQVILVHREASGISEMQTEIDAVKDFKFEIENGIVMKVTVLSHSSTLHSILFSHHHIALDGISWSVFIADLAKAYSKRLNSLPITPGTPQAIDMTRNQLKTLARENLQTDLDFWKNTYSTIPEPLPLFPFAKLKTRPTVRDYGINTCDVRLPRSMSKLVEKAASGVGVTAFHFYFAALATFLSRCLDTKDVAIGIVDANRTEQSEMRTTGYFLNMLPARIMLERSEPFEVVARRSRDAVLAAITHSRAPIDMVINELGLSRSSNHSPLFQVAINYRKAPLNETDFGSDGKIQWDGAVPGGNPYDILLNVASTSDWTFVSFITQRSLYEASDGMLLLKWYTRALEALAQDPSCQVGRCPLSNDIDVEEAVKLGRGIDVEVPWNGTLTDRVDEVTAKLPGDVAIKDEQGQEFTYATMTNRTFQIARELRMISPSLRSGSHVAMLLDPVADAICCILAILRSDLVWIPLDARNHHQRLRAVVRESQPRVLICHNATKQLAQQVATDMESVLLINLDEMNSNDDVIHKISYQNGVEKHDRSAQPAMILYTSGSTGVPKGVVLTHGGLTNQIYGTTITLNLGRETTLQHSPLGFDLMLDQIFLALCSGGTIVMVGKAGRGDPTHIADLMVKNRVTLTHFVPSEYLTLLNYGHHILTKTRSWRYAMSGGEKLGRELRKAFGKLDCDSLQLVNVYGPAEITLACARGIVPFRESGDMQGNYSDYLRPSPNYGLEITDANMNILPIGFPGEICITGRGVGLKYLDRPEESFKKFTRRDTVRIYRSGDYGRLLPDGTLQVLGRLDGDSQVKIHGIRVELDEIANAIVHASNGELVNAAASWRPSQPSGTLVAFVVFAAEFTRDKSDFLQGLRSNLPLPPFMKPSFLVPVQRIPSTPNGKTDRRAVDELPIPEASMKEVWEEVLSTQRIRVSHGDRKSPAIQPTSDFFEVGGSSILIIKLKSLISTQFGINVSMPDLFHSSTLSSMATLLATAASTPQGAATEPETASFLKPRTTQQTIDWDLEIASMADGLPHPRPTSSFSTHRLANGSKGLRVVLTGASGFIGRHLLSHLIQDPRVAQVHCLAIRPDASGKPRRLPMQSEKIIEHTGDLSTLGFGLPDSELLSIAEHVDIIIHNGADVSLLKTYQSLRRANVVSTRKLCEMAIPRRVPVHYVSTASVAKVIEQHADKPLLEVAASPAISELLNSVDGYAASKWVSEMLLDGAAANNELPAYVHRLAHVVGDDASELDAMGMLTKYSLLLRALPRIPAKDVVGKWDFVTVHDVARNIVASAIESATGKSTAQERCASQFAGARFINHCNDVKVSPEELRAYLEGEAGAPIEELEMRDWLTAARARGLHPLVDEFFAAFGDGRGKMVLPVIAR
ncbi:putative beta-ketoacyl synthase domain-containing protein [Rosellinia necatrix]|uniref:Putative beta-ketoacyl synthase domain-containing protein n=1 Tax=Rosellinia necatrix TaxID=77044 RepID=A0A1W2TVB4_ROSNE|nr:putative beta-ketoacyl synthase domain-containing protein [Rosellinia necatrix]